MDELINRHGAIMDRVIRTKISLISMGDEWESGRT